MVCAYLQCFSLIGCVVSVCSLCVVKLILICRCLLLLLLLLFFKRVELFRPPYVFASLLLYIYAAFTCYRNYHKYELPSRKLEMNGLRETLYSQLPTRKLVFTIIPIARECSIKNRLFTSPLCIHYEALMMALFPQQSYAPLKSSTFAPFVHWHPSYGIKHGL